MATAEGASRPLQDPYTRAAGAGNNAPHIHYGGGIVFGCGAADAWVADCV
jgi:hypothetical protein